MTIHNVFYVDRFKPIVAPPAVFSNRTHSRPAAEIVDGEEEFEVKTLIDHVLTTTASSSGKEEYFFLVE
ncbi:hypothetical protein DFQ27_003422 [Actinomortierella ambigua]|uniref:Uncharacterized protein n=1 Tax=Actinomortierella ambigua TaxID=1343610 RepID=A0A9P6Q972_9FUNG|nr:hypothetical protein DFQ27_003422 [Actinomortierella ambigua]